MSAYDLGRVIGTGIAIIIGLVLGIKVLIKGNKMQQTGMGVLGLIACVVGAALAGMIGAIPLYFIFTKAVIKDNSMAYYQQNMQCQNNMYNQNNMQYPNNMYGQNNINMNNMNNNNNSNNFGYYQ